MILCLDKLCIALACGGLAYGKCTCTYKRFEPSQISVDCQLVILSHPNLVKQSNIQDLQCEQSDIYAFQVMTQNGNFLIRMPSKVKICFIIMVALCL